MLNQPSPTDDFLNRLLPYPCGPRLLELRKELEAHLQEAMEDYLREGMAENEAFQAAVQTLGPMRGLKRHIRRMHHRGGRRKPIQLLAGLSLLLLYPLAVYLVFPHVSVSFPLLLPVLLGGAMLGGLGFGTRMDMLGSKYEPLEDNREFTALFGNGMKYKE